MNILKKINSMAGAMKGTLTPKQVFTSGAVRDYLKSLIYNLTSDAVKDRIRLDIMADEDSDMTACTEGSRIVVNVCNPVVDYYKSMASKFLTLCGMVFHECGHILYLDFAEDAKCRKALLNGTFPGREPEPETETEEANLEEFRETLADPTLRQALAMLYGQLSNIVADVHDETRLKDNFGSLVRKGLYFCEESLRSTCRSLEEMRKRRMSDFSILLSLLLQTARFQDVFTEDENGRKDELYEAVEDILVPLDSAINTDSTKEKYSLLNVVVLKLWPYIQEIFKSQSGGSGSESDSGSGGEGSSSAPMSEEEKEKLTEALKDALKEAMESSGGSASEPERKETSETAKKARKKEESGKKGEETEKSGSGEVSPEAAEDSVKGLLENLEMDAARELAEDAVDAELAATLKATMDGYDCSARDRYICRVTGVDESVKDEYMRILNEVKPYSRRLQKGIARILEDLRMGCVNHHRRMGKLVEASEAYRPDKRFFADKKLPQDVPDLAVCILVDESGSMSGNKIEAARKAAIMLHDFTLGLKVPTHVAGHTTEYRDDNLKYNIYSDYESCGERDRFRLMAMKADCNNRDGAAIDLAAEHLSRRPEEVKLMLVISDGQPCAERYWGPAANKDTADTVTRWRNKGIEIIGICIDAGEMDVIHQIYGDYFIDGMDLEALPKIMLNLVKKRIVR